MRTFSYEVLLKERHGFKYFFSGSRVCTNPPEEIPTFQSLSTFYQRLKIWVFRVISTNYRINVQLLLSLEVALLLGQFWLIDWLIFNFFHHCRCDDGYGGETCVPVVPLKGEIKSNFSLVSQLASDWLEVVGGQLAASQHGCGTIVSGESLYFSQVHSYSFALSYRPSTQADCTIRAAPSGECNGQRSTWCAINVSRSYDWPILYHGLVRTACL